MEYLAKYGIHFKDLFENKSIGQGTLIDTEKKDHFFIFGPSFFKKKIEDLSFGIGSNKRGKF